MRILLYVEPHPIRNSKTHFTDVAKEFLPLLRSSPRLDVRMFANGDTLKTLGDAADANEARLIRPTQDEEAMIDRYMVPWDGEGIPIWLTLMDGTGEVTKGYHALLQRIWNRFPFDVIVHWGENGAITRFTDEHAVARVAMELGCTRPPFLSSLVMDLYGTNGAAVVPKLTIDNIREIVAGRPMSRHEALFAYSENLETLGYEQQFRPLPTDLSERVSRADKVAFLPLQLYDDANLLRFSPYCTLQDVVMDVVPKLAQQGYTTIIKPHPAAKHRPDSNFQNLMARRSIQAWSDSFIWWEEPGSNNTNAKLIEISDVVLTVNSSLGFEALYFDKTVVVLGDAIYKPQGLFPTLDMLVEGTFDRKTYLERIGYLRRFFLGGYLQPASIRNEPAAFAQRVGLLVDLHHRHLGSPMDVAREFWQVSAPPIQAYATSVMFAGTSMPGTLEFGAPTLPAPSPPTRKAAKENLDQTILPWILISQRLRMNSGTVDVCAFSSWLDVKRSQAQGLREIVEMGQILDAKYYLDANHDVRAAGMEAMEHFVPQGFLEGRPPRAGLLTGSFDEMITSLKLAAEQSLDTELLPEYPLSESENTARHMTPVSMENAFEGKSNRIAVVAHLYYKDLVPTLLERLKALSEGIDLYVTLPDWGTRQIKEMVGAVYPEAIFYHAANRGRDIGPFVDVLPLIIDRNYDAVLKIQTKRGYYQGGRLLPEYGDLWREECFAALLGSTQRVSDILEAFRADASLAMIGPSSYFLGLDDYPYHDQGYLANALLSSDSATGFFAGTMFWCKPRCLKDLVGPGKLSITKFAPETGANDGALAHLAERMFGHAPESGDFKIVGAPVNPDVPLDFNLKPTKDRIHDHLTDALARKRARKAAKATTSLAR